MAPGSHRRTRWSGCGRRGSERWPWLLFPDVAELEEHHHRQKGEDEEGDRRALAEVAALEADLVGEGGEEVGRVNRAAAGQDLEDVEVPEGEDGREKDHHAEH